jgi:sulfate transport system substrate-binding protein
LTRVVQVLLPFAALAVALLTAACGGASVNARGTKLTLVAYSTPREAYDELTKEFAQTAAGKGVSFDQSYGSSGEQSRAVEAGLDADVLALSLAQDVQRLVNAGLVDEQWADDGYDGVVTNSVVVFAVRQGNPKGITTWDDLTQDGVEVITPNPFTSGGARWNVMAAYGAQQRLGKTHEQAIEYLGELFKHASVQDKSARESLQTFTGGKGDVLIAYENEAITAQQKGEEIDYVIPDQTVLIENPIAVTKGSNAKAAAFVEFLRSEQAQKVFAEKGYRSPIPSVLLETRNYPQPQVLFTIDSLGGWDKVQETFFDREDGIMAGIERNAGAALE